MKVTTVVVGMLEENCYIVSGEKSSVVIDPGDDADVIIHETNKIALPVSHILLTHGHADHIGAAEEVRKRTGALLCVSEKDEEMLYSGQKNLSAFMNEDIKTEAADIVLKEGMIIKSDDLAINVIETPGHTMGGICFICGDSIFSGDTIFENSIGRTDFPGGSFEKLQDSIKSKLYSLSGDYKIYPGHGNATTLEHEKNSNAFVRCDR